MKFQKFSKPHQRRKHVKKIPPQLCVLLLLLLCWQWPWALWFGSFNWIVTVTLLQTVLIFCCSALSRDLWVTLIIAIEFFCMLFNVTLFYFDLHRLAIQEQIMLIAFIIELLIISLSLGASLGRFRTAGLCGNIQRVFGCHDMLCSIKTMGANS